MSEGSRTCACAAAEITRHHPAFSLGNDLHHGTFSAEHSFSVDPDNQNGGGRERERVVRLCVGPDRIVALKMEQCREQDAAARFVK